jgi:hypothetical protein
VNNAPVITVCPPPTLVVNACDIYTYPFAATDVNKCLVFAWSLLAPEAGMTIVPGTGVFAYEPPAVAAICGSHAATVVVTDEFGAADTCTFSIDVQTDAPMFTVCPTPETEPIVLWGNPMAGQVTAVDPDADLPLLNGCPLGLTYSLVSFSGPGTRRLRFQPGV